MTLAKRAASALVFLAILIVAALYLPFPVNAAAWLILVLFALLLFLPLLLAVINMIAADDEGWFGGHSGSLVSVERAGMAVARPASDIPGAHNFAIRKLGPGTATQAEAVAIAGSHPVGSRPVNCPNNADTQLRCRTVSGSSSAGSPTTTTVRAAIS